MILFLALVFSLAAVLFLALFLPSLLLSLVLFLVFVFFVLVRLSPPPASAALFHDRELVFFSLSKAPFL